MNKVRTFRQRCVGVCDVTVLELIPLLIVFFTPFITGYFPREFNLRFYLLSRYYRMNLHSRAYTQIRLECWCCY